VRLREVVDSHKELLTRTRVGIGGQLRQLADHIFEFICEFIGD
jgi:hypothetical protein